MISLPRLAAHSHWALVAHHLCLEHSSLRPYLSRCCPTKSLYSVCVVSMSPVQAVQIHFCARFCVLSPLMATASTAKRRQHDTVAVAIGTDGASRCLCASCGLVVSVRLDAKEAHFSSSQWPQCANTNGIISLAKWLPCTALCLNHQTSLTLCMVSS